MRNADGRLAGAIDAGVRELGPQITARVVREPPIVGAALLGLDELGSDALALSRAREELTNGSLVHG
jgi:hypothetical protein